jgi:hypothetical protein
MKSIVPVLAFGLALSTAVMVANQHRAWSPGPDGGSSLATATRFSGRSTAAGHPARHGRIERVAQGARQDAVSAPGAPPASTTGASAFDRIRVDEIAPDVYVVSAMDLLIALSQADALTATIQPMLSFNTGPKYWIDSFVLEGALGGQGFTVVAPKLMRRAGIEPGDTLRTLNGRPIDPDVDIQDLLREISRDPLNSVIRLEVERQGVKLTKTYQLG